MESVEGFILAGGKSSRMGQDKSRLTIGGETFIDRIARELSHVADSVTIVGGDQSEAELRHVPDVYPEWGALGGIHAALSSSVATYAIIVACDFPFVTSELFETLVALAANCDAVVPIQSDGIVQPLCALYRVDVCLQRVEQLIKTSEHRPIALLQSVNTRWLQFEEIAALNNASRFFDNINTPEDYVRITQERI